MSHASLRQLSDHEVLPRLAEVVARDRCTTVEMLGLIGQAEVRRLYADEDCTSMFAYCVRTLRMSEDVAFTRIRAARLARRYAAILPALADGRLHLAALRRLAPHLTRENAAELLAAAEHRSRRELELLLAARFPRPDIPTALVPLPPVVLPVAVPDQVVLTQCPNAPGMAELPVPGRVDFAGVSGTSGPGPGHDPVPEPVAVTLPPTWLMVSPLSPQRYGLRATIDEESAELLDRAKSLLMHVMPGADYAEVLKRVLSDWVLARERQKYGLTDKPRARTSKVDGRYIPRQVRREVQKRDGGQCTFVGKHGQRCEAREQLEYDHIKPFARGGRTTTENLRLRCRTHNQLDADRTYGAGFMQRKREGRVAERPRPGECPASIYSVTSFRTLSRPSASSSAARITAGRGEQSWCARRSERHRSGRGESVGASRPREHVVDTRPGRANRGLLAISLEVRLPVAGLGPHERSRRN